jgi:imidazolonepropionase-like amidohydrolase
MRVLLLLVLLTGSAQAQLAVDSGKPFPLLRPDAPLLAPYDLPAQYLLKGATVHTGTGEVIKSGQVLVVDGVIRDVGTNINAVLHKEIDLTGLHLYPGLISASSPLGLLEIGAVRATRDTTEVGSYTPDVKSWLAINPDSELIPVARSGGVAYSLAVPAGGIVAGQSGLIQLAGWGMEEMAFAKPVALHVNWPGMGLRLAPKTRLKDPKGWKSPADQDKARKRKITELTDFFKDARAYQRARNNSDENFVTVPAWDAMLPYLKREKPLFVHADDLRQIKSAIIWSRTNQLKIVICGGRDSWMVADQLATNGIPVVYEHVLERPARDTDSFDQAYAAPAVLIKAGVETAISLGRGRFSASMARNLSHAAAHAARHGLTTEQAIQAITRAPAKILGVEDKVGIIVKGGIATLIATDGPLLDVRSSVRQMWIAGISVSLENRQTRLYRRYQQRPKLK